jgi:hypothetical protein
MFLTGYRYYWLPFSSIEITDCPFTIRDREKEKDLETNNLFMLCHLMMLYPG